MVLSHLSTLKFKVDWEVEADVNPAALRMGATGKYLFRWEAKGQLKSVLQTFSLPTVLQQCGSFTVSVAG